MKFIELINVKMPTNVGILTNISTISTTSENLKARDVFIFSGIFAFMSIRNFMLSEMSKKIVLYPRGHFLSDG